MNLRSFIAACASTAVLALLMVATAQAETAHVKLITAPEGMDLKKAEKILHQYKIEKLQEHYKNQKI